MNAFKKFAALLLALMIILSLAACGSKSDDSAICLILIVSFLRFLVIP